MQLRWNFNKKSLKFSTIQYFTWTVTLTPFHLDKAVNQVCSRVIKKNVSMLQMKESAAGGRSDEESGGQQQQQHRQQKKKKYQRQEKREEARGSGRAGLDWLGGRRAWMPWRSSWALVPIHLCTTDEMRVVGAEAQLVSMWLTREWRSKTSGLYRWSSARLPTSSLAQLSSTSSSPRRRNDARKLWTVISNLSLHPTN